MTLRKLSVDPAGFGISSYDKKVFGYTGSDITTITYSLDGVTVGVLTISYDSSSNPTSIERTT